MGMGIVVVIVAFIVFMAVLIAFPIITPVNKLIPDSILTGTGFQTKYEHKGAKLEALLALFGVDVDSTGTAYFKGALLSRQEIMVILATNNIKMSIDHMLWTSFKIDYFSCYKFEKLSSGCEIRYRMTWFELH